jgi:GH25 family lysozyme M1 (1,4-beta-N-acetylmuramidase)
MVSGGPPASRRRHGLPVGWIAAGLALAIIATAVVLTGRSGSLRSPAVSPSSPAMHLPGVDVSSHDRPVDWKKAAGFGLRFVIARATEGDSRVDTAYPSIRRAATSAGLAVTAFHFARPDKGRGDAVREADLFVDIAKLRSGDLAPVLDLEVTGGLRSRRLISWVTDWVAEVASRVGVKPMIYTNANFWRTRMGDTTLFAAAGYPLYIASWDAATPAIPAFDWDGHGWTMWQTAECGRVPGAPGCIRTDRFNGASLHPITIP